VVEEQTQKQATLCNFETIECEQEQHEKCHETYSNTELDLEARCVCDCHSDKKKKQPLARESELTAGDDGRLQLDDFGLGAANGNKRNTRQ
jgi:hypothetical protein